MPKGDQARFWQETGRGGNRETGRGGNRAGRHGRTGHEETGRRIGKPVLVNALPRTSRGERYLALFVVVRRQRVQTSAFVGTPFWVMMRGWRFGW